jgi:hypothetical protein
MAHAADPHAPADGSNAFSLQGDLTRLDAEIRRVRFDESLSPEECLCQLSELMQERNRLFDRLREAKVHCFKEFVQDLHLRGIGAQSVFGQGRRLRIMTQDQGILGEDAAQPPGRMGRKRKRTGMITPWQRARNDLLVARRTAIANELKAMDAESPWGAARRTRLELELGQIEAHLGRKK